MTKYKLEHTFNLEDTREFIGYAESEDECSDLIRLFLREIHYKEPYIRYNFLGNEVQIDVGSWCHFIYITRFDNQNIKISDFFDEYK